MTTQEAEKADAEARADAEEAGVVGWEVELAPPAAPVAAQVDPWGMKAFYL